MYHTYEEKDKLYKLCREINSGLFSDNAENDIKEMLILYKKCGNFVFDKDEEKKNAQRNKADKKHLLKVIYICFVNMSEIDLSASERLTYAEEIIKPEGFLYQSTKHGTRSISLDFLRLCKKILADEFAGKDAQKQSELLKEAHKVSAIKLLLLNKL